MPKRKYQRTLSFVFCQHYEHQLFINGGQRSREIKGPATMSSSRDSVTDSCIRDVLLNMAVLLLAMVDFISKSAIY